MSRQRKCNAIAKAQPILHARSQAPKPSHAPIRFSALARLVTSALEEHSVSNMRLLNLAPFFVLCEE